MLYSIIFASLCKCQKNNKLYRTQTPGSRIVSFAPSITETIFALGLQQHLVGVTNFCSYPEEARKLPKVGGYVDPNYEQILLLKPDIAFLLKEHEKLIGFLEKYHVRTVTIDNHSIGSILNSFSLIAEECGIKDRGDSLKEVIVSVLKTGPGRLPRVPRVLFCVGRDKPGTGIIGKVFCAGPRSFYSELITAAGGENAVDDSGFIYPSFAGEGIITMEPDIVIDAMASNKSLDPVEVCADWSVFSMLPAVKLGAVYALTGSHISIPGPRIVEIYRDLHRCFGDWNSRLPPEGE